MWRTPLRRHASFRAIPAFPFVPIVPLAVSAGILGLLIANYRVSRRIEDIVSGTEEDVIHLEDEMESNAPPASC